MKLIMPGQTDVLLGAKAFRAALDNLSALLPPGFAIENLTHLEGDNEVVSIVEWSSSRVAASQFAVRFRFSEGKIFEERWFVDTKQWAAAF